MRNAMRTMVVALVIMASFTFISKGETSKKEALESSKNEFVLQVANNVKYNAKEFVAVDLALETENWLNSATETSNDTFEAVTIRYNAAEYVAAEMALETENWMNSTIFDTTSGEKISYDKNMDCK